ncbi:MmyB family transcriptional regulator [Halostreptopolyspora alba]|uniref:XRE family transcriptional regulator n=1 Tax=Halostreptopolyspora alba TaxID=2487137 RepID=A0A3N0EHQ0_9ACTN|nr:XRE family transcriptional regulator [Nocardiopsaceae bacterium YIM 96095]
MGTPQQRELGTFLRAHREWTSPGDVGLPPGTRRRTPGLRREEVATLAGVSLAWYTWLEQGRVTTSRQILDAVCRVLRLDAPQRDHALHMAGFAAPAPSSDEATRYLHDLIESWDAPAAVLDWRLDVLAGNAPHHDLWTGQEATLPEQHNPLLMLTSQAWPAHHTPEGRELVLDLYGIFRAGVDHHPTDTRATRIRELLDERRSELADWWRCRAVRQLTPRTLEVPHPRGERLNLTFGALSPHGWAGPLVLTQIPADEGSRRVLTEHRQAGVTGPE